MDDLLDELDGSGSDSEWAAVKVLRHVLGDQLPSHLLRQYRSEKSWKARSAYVYHAVRYAKNNDDAVELGKLAIKDRSRKVRYRAAMLLACSLRRDLLPFLDRLAKEIGDEATRKDIAAAMDAIAEQNHNYFVDRDHSGKVVLNIH